MLHLTIPILLASSLDVRPASDLPIIPPLVKSSINAHLYMFSDSYQLLYQENITYLYSTSIIQSFAIFSITYPLQRHIYLLRDTKCLHAFETNNNTYFKYFSMKLTLFDHSQFPLCMEISLFYACF